MEQLRLFISLPLDIGLAKKLHKQFQQLDLPWDSMRLTLPDQMHLTLKFLGAVPLDKIPEIIQALESMDSIGENIELTLGQAIVSTIKRPEVIFIRIQNNEQLSKLFKKIEETLFTAGLSNLESRQFSPHVTLARIKKNINPEDISSLNNWKINEHFSSSFFSLMQSELTPRGPLYTSLQNFDL